jgi:hypothetical protein
VLPAVPAGQPTDEPDWSHDPAVGPRTGTKYYDDGRVIAWDGRVIQEATPVAEPSPEIQAEAEPPNPYDRWNFSATYWPSREAGE